MQNHLRGVAALSSSDIWVVGSMGLSSSEPLILRWNGSGWKVVANACGVPLNGIVAVAPDDLWAAGDSTLCHYDGRQWTVVPSPKPRPEYWEVAYPLQRLAGRSRSCISSTSLSATTPAI